MTQTNDTELRQIAASTPVGAPMGAAPLPYDIYFTGVGGQGVLTIGEIITQAAFARSIPVNFFPTKGMAQRGGFVKAQLRMGREIAGPSIPERGAHLVIATEVSEALKAVRFCRPDASFVLYAAVWAPTAVMLGKTPYPSLQEVQTAIAGALDQGGRLHTLLPEKLPRYGDAPVPDNIYTLAVALRCTPLGQILSVAEVREIIRSRWQRGAELNLYAFQAGLDAEP